MARLRQKPPAWFWIVSAIITVWAVIGVGAFYMDAAMTDAARAQLSAYDRNLLASRPAWFLWVYAISTISGLLGGVALLLRSRAARALFVVSLVTVVFMFGFIFAVTDLIAVKGFLTAAGFPILVAIIAVGQVWFAGMAARRRWIE